MASVHKRKKLKFVVQQVLRDNSIRQQLKSAFDFRVTFRRAINFNLPFHSAVLVSHCSLISLLMPNFTLGNASKRASRRIKTGDIYLCLEISLQQSLTLIGF